MRATVDGRGRRERADRHGASLSPNYSTHFKYQKTPLITSILLLRFLLVTALPDDESIKQKERKKKQPEREREKETFLLAQTSYASKWESGLNIKSQNYPHSLFCSAWRNRPFFFLPLDSLSNW